MIELSKEERELLLQVLNEYPRNMREPCESNGEFEEHLKRVDALIKKVQN